MHPHGPSEDSNLTAQADLNLYLGHLSKGMFSDIATQMFSDMINQNKPLSFQIKLKKKKKHLSR